MVTEKVRRAIGRPRITNRFAGSPLVDGQKFTVHRVLGSETRRFDDVRQKRRGRGVIDNPADGHQTRHVFRRFRVRPGVVAVVVVSLVQTLRRQTLALVRLRPGLQVAGTLNHAISSI